MGIIYQQTEREREGKTASSHALRDNTYLLVITHVMRGYGVRFTSDLLSVIGATGVLSNVIMLNGCTQNFTHTNRYNTRHARQR